MIKEDYFKYYIQGSEHYLIPKDIFEELFEEMNNWKNESHRQKILKELYRDRLDKAISFINEKSFRDDINFPNAYGLGISSTNELLEILKGGKDD